MQIVVGIATAALWQKRRAVATDKSDTDLVIILVLGREFAFVLEDDLFNPTRFKQQA